MSFRRDMRPHGAGERALVGDCKRRVAQPAARFTSSSGCEAPRRKVKFERQCSSA